MVKIKLLKELNNLIDTTTPMTLNECIEFQRRLFERTGNKFYKGTLRILEMIKNNELILKDVKIIKEEE